MSTKLVFIFVIGVLSTFVVLRTLVLKPQQDERVQKLYKPHGQPTQSFSPRPTAKSVTSWLKYTNTVSKYMIEYPQSWVVDERKDLDRRGSTVASYVGFTVNLGGVYLVWLEVHRNPEKLSPVQFWAQKDAFWEHVEPGTAVQRLQRAQYYYDRMERVKVGTDTVEGYKITVPDVLKRTEIYWFIKNMVFNLGFSPEDESYDYTAEQKAEIVNHMLATFEVIN